MSNTSPQVFAGVDVGKQTLQLALSLADGTFPQKPFTNDAPGRLELVKLCQKQQVVLVVMEATGGLELDVAADLAHEAIPVSVITPAQSAAFAKALGQRAKTDPIDAQRLAVFARKLSPAASTILSETQRNLRELAARRRQIIGQCVQEKNRRHQAHDARVVKSIEKAIGFLEGQLEDIDGHLGALIAADADLQVSVDRLDTVPGIGADTARQLVVLCPELGTMNRQQIAALAGLAPFNRDSGSLNGRRTIRGGRGALRSLLYMCMLSAIRCNPVVKRFYHHLLGQGKKKMLALTACMRKFIIMLNSMTRLGKTWNQFIANSD